ncbi:phosphatidylglycerophosphatase B [Aerococcus viridans]|uniref:Phosphatidic acid phosphatase n=2 Tax=Aerococcus viridans TaxID=1377 RepID=A0AAU8UNL3_9LACT|nr:phosphatase PAP2 family protein [Aerococcus viridans]AMC01417.1 phosphatidic acid phosphatase [Aerococcus viridans]EFG49715.1 PAP2 family protein [Aerococcus viridans ATCC 11563 = CCUG 4311]SUU15423.1 phosphatidylglycerophosphatase B [Aerococcus viridans]
MKKDPILPYLIASAITAIPFILICLTAMIDVDFLTVVDQNIGQHLYQWGPPPFTTFVQSFTLIGNAQGIIPLTMIIAGIFYYISRKWQVFLWIVFTILVGVGPVVDLIKNIIRRTRPSYLTHLVDQGGYSFPSGHATGAVLAWGTLAFLIWYYFKDKYPKMMPYLIGFTIFMVVAISASRLYLGVHYLSDIIAGWSIGATWLILCLNYFNLFIADKIALENEVKDTSLKEE